MEKRPVRTSGGAVVGPILLLILLDQDQEFLLVKNKMGRHTARFLATSVIGGVSSRASSPLARNGTQPRRHQRGPSKSDPIMPSRSSLDSAISSSDENINVELSCFPRQMARHLPSRVPNS